MSQAADKTTKHIAIAMISGLALGLLLYFSGNSELTLYIKPLGTIFIRLLKMMIIPLVFSSIYMSMLNLGSPEQLGKMGRNAVLYYFTTTAIAVGIGLVLVNIFQPGNGASLETATALSDKLSTKLSAQKGLIETIMGVIIDAIPNNPFGSMANSNVLQVIVFSLLLGIVALFHNEESRAVSQFMESLEKMSLTLTHWIMKLAPIGIFVLMIDTIAQSGLNAIISLSKYMFVVVFGLLIHACFLLTVAVVRLKKSPLHILKAVLSPLLTAFSTSSSAATLPITMVAVEEELGVRKKTAKFVLPLGATINMDGTALYESVAVIFIAQAYNIPLTLGQQGIIFMTASLAAIGAAAIPGAGLITMSIVLSAVGMPLDGIGLILAVDRLLDMFRTAVNVFGDCVGTVVVDSLVTDDTSDA